MSKTTRRAPPGRLTREQVAEVLGRSLSTVKRWIAERLMPAPQGPTRQTRTWDEADILAWIDAGQPPARDWALAKLKAKR